jgi:hypothetical protein
MWLHRRSEEPSSTQVESYWKKSKLSALGNEMKPIKVREMTGATPICPLKDGTFRKEVVAALEGEGHFGSGLMSLTFQLNGSNLAIPQMLLSYKVRAHGKPSADDFLSFSCKLMHELDLCEAVFCNTKAQHKSALWHQLRLGRISASRAYEVMKCKTTDGVLVDLIVGARKLKDSQAMKRGRELEGEVLRELEKRMDIKIENCGLALNPDYPFLGATPDGMFANTLVEVKCPQKEVNVHKYIKDGKPTPKYEAQMVVQMVMLGKKQCLYAVADPAFEENGKIFTTLVEFNDILALEILETCRNFWCNVIFKVLFK